MSEVSDVAIRQRLLSMLEQRQAPATLCPSEVARDLMPGGPWRDLMPRIREQAQALAGQGLVEALRQGRRVDATSPGGPIRLRLLKSKPRP